MSTSATSTENSTDVIDADAASTDLTDTAMVVGQERPVKGERPPGRSRTAALLIWSYILATVVSAGALTYISFGRELPSLPELVFFALNIPVFPSLVSVVLLALITSALVRRKRLALIAVGLLQLFGALYGIGLLAVVLTDTVADVTASEVAPVLVASAMSPISAIIVLILLVRARAEFPGAVARRSWPWALVVGAGGTLLTVAVTALLLNAVGESPDSEMVVLLLALLRSIGLMDGGIDGIPALVSDLAGIMLGLTIIAAAAIFLRSPRAQRTRTGTDEVALRTLLAEHGHEDSLSYFATRRDKDLVFSPDGKAVVAYQVTGAVAVVAGDPVGARHSWDGAIDEYLRLCRRNGWMPSVLSAGEDAAWAWTRHGMIAVPMGDEAILDLEHADLTTAGLTAVRRAAARARAEGLEVKIRRHSSLTPEERVEMIRCADAWRHDGDERGFSMALSRLGDPADGACVLVSAHESDGSWVGLLSFVPWGRTGISLDVMRRAPEAPHGVTELMVASLIEDGSRLGIRRASLNFAMFRHVFIDARKLGAGVSTRFAALVLQKADRWFQLERLYRSNQKYRPAWVPRYMLADGLLALPRTALASSALEGFSPRLSRPEPPAPALTDDELEQVRRLEERAPVAADLAPRRSDQSRHRVRHLEELAAAGMEPYPVGLPQPMPLAEVAALVHGRAGGGSSAEASTVACEPSKATASTRPGAAETGATGPGEATASTRPGEAGAESPGEPLRVSGRVRRLRDLGGVVFAELVEGQARLQIILERDRIGAQALDLFAKTVDLGDIVQVTGAPGVSRRGEPSLVAQTWVMASKVLQPVPFDSFEDPESRLRRRSTDLIVHPQNLQLLRERSAVIQAVRQVLLDEGALEVETPILATVHGGANARPFRTRINAYSTDLTLRIAPELQLKRLMVGGLGAIFEIGRNFRNEGADATHNPEFTALEAYVPYSDYTGMRHLTERIVRAAARAVHGREVLPLPMTAPSGVEGAAPAVGADPAGAPAVGTDPAAGTGPSGELVPSDPTSSEAASAEPAWVLTDVSGEWPVVTVCDAVSRAVGREITIDTDIDVLLELTRIHDIEVRDDMGPGALIEELYGELVEPATIMPTFYVDFPAETSPLTAPHRSMPGLVERWDLVAGGMEIGTAYSELADPLIQRDRLTAQSLKAAAGDPEAMEVDEDFLFALENGMPPAGGLGIGMDRLAMLVTHSTIRDVLTFPFVRPLRNR